MFGLMLALFFFLLFIQLLTGARKFFNSASQSIVSVFTAGRFSSGKVTYKEMEARNIHPYFCPREQMVLWVQNPSKKEHCPSCGSDIFIFYRNMKVVPRS